MSKVPPMNDDARSDDNERDDVLNAVASKWKRLSRKELSALKSTDELAAQIMAKYEGEKIATQRDVDAPLDGRNVAAFSSPVSSARRSSKAQCGGFCFRDNVVVVELPSKSGMSSDLSVPDA